jgi:hypothetical protein
MIDRRIEKTIILIYEQSLKTIKKNAMTRIIAFDEQYKNRETIFHWVNDVIRIFNWSQAITNKNRRKQTTILQTISNINKKTRL